MVFSQDGKLLASAGGFPSIRVKLWDVASATVLRTFSIADSPYSCVAFSPDGKLVASGNVATWLGPDGKPLATVGRNNTIKIWDVVSGTLRQTLTVHSDPVFSMAFSPNGDFLASAIAPIQLGPDGKLQDSEHGYMTIKVWDLASGKPRQTLTLQQDEMADSIAFSPDGITVASGNLRKIIGPDGKPSTSTIASSTIKIWDMPSGMLTQTLTVHSDEASSVAFSPDGKLLASGILFSGMTPDLKHIKEAGTDEKTIKLWDVASWTLRQSLTGHSDAVYCIAFSPDGRLLASGSDDKTIKLWRRTQ